MPTSNHYIPARPWRTFVSYAHDDRRLKDQFLIHLAALRREGLIREWHDRAISPGTDIDASIAKELEAADLVILLLSPKFIESEYCYQKELQTAFERAQRGTCRVVPLIIKPCQWQIIRIDTGGALGNFKAIPTDGKPVVRWKDRDSAFNDATEAIRNLIMSATTASVIAEEQHSYDMLHGMDPAAEVVPGSGRAKWFKDFDYGPELVIVPPGSSKVGSPPTEVGRYDNDWPLTQISIEYPFAVSRFCITVREYTAFLTATKHPVEDHLIVWSGGRRSVMQGCSFYNPGYRQHDDFPAVGISWFDAKAYITWLRQMTGKRYRMLTEVEWEYVARSGSRGENVLFSWGNEPRHDKANFSMAEDGTEGTGEPVPVDSYEPNDFGLFNINGNVWEWVEDGYLSAESQPKLDSSMLRGGVSLAQGTTLKIFRGGAFISLPRNMRTANRNYETPEYRSNAIGLRVARSV